MHRILAICWHAEALTFFNLLLFAIIIYLLYELHWFLLMKILI